MSFDPIMYSMCKKLGGEGGLPIVSITTDMFNLENGDLGNITTPLTAKEGAAIRNAMSTSDFVILDILQDGYPSVVIGRKMEMEGMTILMARLGYCNSGFLQLGSLAIFNMDGAWMASVSVKTT